LRRCAPYVNAMALEPDLLFDRRRLKRRLSLWRAAALLSLAGLAISVALFRTELRGLLPGGGPEIARLNVTGFIGDDRKVMEALERVGKNDSVRALIVAIDSPGGSVAGGEALHHALARLAATKPVVAVMGGTATSAGYMVALPTARIFARDSTVTGSIGVILQNFDVSSLMAWLGVRAESLASGPFKANPSPFAPMTEAGRAELMRVVNDLHAQFVAMVAAGRRMEPDAVRALADGRVFTGREAHRLGLVDAIGGEVEARAWLVAERGVPEGLPVRDVQTRSLADRGFGAFWGALTKNIMDEWVGVDRLRAVWQPVGP
jgi:protease-4